MTPKILYNFACRNRKEKMFSAIENIIELSSTTNYLIQLSLDVDDIELTSPEVVSRINSYGSNVKAYWGISHSKISAINRDIMLGYPFDIVCTHSDDMVFVKHGFDVEIIKEFNGFSGLLHFPDGRVNERLCTYSIMDKGYYEKFKYIYYPEYKSVFCDNEQTDVAKILGMYKYVNKNIIEHRHYRAGYGEPDELMKHNDSPEMYRSDSEIYYRRKSINFGLGIRKTAGGIIW